MIGPAHTISIKDGSRLTRCNDCHYYTWGAMQQCSHPEARTKEYSKQIVKGYCPGHCSFFKEKIKRR